MVPQSLTCCSQFQISFKFDVLENFQFFSMIRHCKILIDPAARATIICRNKTEGGGTEQDFLTLARQRLDRYLSI